MRHLLTASFVAALAGCAEPIPAYAPYESEAQRETAFEKVRPHCKNPEAARPSCNVLILYRLPTGETQVGVVRGIRPNGFEVMWTTSIAEGYTTPELVPLESPEYKGDITEAASVDSEKGLKLMGKAMKVMKDRDDAVGKRIL